MLETGGRGERGRERERERHRQLLTMERGYCEDRL